MSDSEHSGSDHPAPEITAVPERALETGDMPNCLSLLCKTDSGLAHAYVKLDAKQMKLTNVEALQAYEHLRYVNLSQNFLENISTLNKLRSLLWLKINQNRLESARLEKLPYLQVVDFSGNKIRNVLGIEHPHLEQLNLNHNDIPSLEGLEPKDLPNLISLQLRSNQLSSTSGVENFKNLKHLFIAANRITSLEGISTLESLEILHIRDNQIQSFGENFVDGCLKNLRYINLRANNVDKMEEVKKLSILPKLTELVLTDNPLVEEEDYRLEVLCRVRRLDRLDKDPFDEDEREQAQEKYEEMMDAAANVVEPEE